MKYIFAILLSTFLSAPLFAQHEYAPIELKDIEYKNWKYSNAVADGKTDLREFTSGKKLVLVFYFAPWCHSSRYQAPVTQRLFEKYSDLGFGIIGVSMYDTIEALKYELRTRKLTFPVVVESTELSARRTSQHYKYRWSTGDHRKWGTPWNIFLIPSEMNSKGDVLTERTFVANGELREDEAESFIRERLGLPPLSPDSTAKATDEQVFEECKPGPDQ